MDQINSRIGQVYGYAVCLITVIVMLIAIKGVVDAAFDLSDPIRADGGGYGNLLLIVLAGVLFGIHWRWLRARDSVSTTG